MTASLERSKDAWKLHVKVAKALHLTLGSGSWSVPQSGQLGGRLSLAYHLNATGPCTDPRVESEGDMYDIV